MNIWDGLKINKLRVLSLGSIFFIALVICSSLLAAVDSSSSSDKQANSLDNFVFEGQSDLSQTNDNGVAKSKIFPTVWCTDITHEATKISCWQSYRNGLDYYKFGLEHRKNVLKWQHFSTKIILVVVLLLVSMGLYFSWSQFRAGTAESIAPISSTEIEISSERIKISSPVLGVVILFVSLAFFYLYLVYVYPITEVI